MSYSLQTLQWWYVRPLYSMSYALINPIFQGIIATMVQLFFAWRVKVLTGNWWLVTLIVITASTSFCTSHTHIPTSMHPNGVDSTRSRRHRHGHRNPLRPPLRGLPEVQRHRHRLAHRRRHLRQHHHPLTHMAPCKSRMFFAVQLSLTGICSVATRRVSPARMTS